MRAGLVDLAALVDLATFFATFFAAIFTILVTLRGAEVRTTRFLPGVSLGAGRRDLVRLAVVRLDAARRAGGAVFEARRSRDLRVASLWTSTNRI